MPYVANKRNLAQITNVHYWDSGAAAWSGNLIGAAAPIALLPNPVQQTDLVVFGVDTSVINSGPFCSLVFDIAAAITGVTVLTWRYSDIGGNDPLLWQTMVGFSPFQDNTNASGLGTGVAFDTSGINSVHWEQPALWVPRVPIIGGVSLGVTGYWICARMDNVPGAATPPTQTNRRIYTILWPAIEVAADDVGGDMAALLRAEVKNESSNGVGLTIDPSTRIIVGARKTSRGENFTSYINLADEQNPTGITITAVAPGAPAVDVQTPTGAKIAVTNPAANWAVHARIVIDSTIAPEFRGLFHGYMRVDQTSGVAGDISARLRVDMEADGFQNTVFTSNVATLLNTNSWEVYDFGRVQLVPDDLDDDTYGIVILVDLYGNAASDIDLFDVILIPVDEWAGEFEMQSTGLISWGLRATAMLGSVLDMDSITVPRRAMLPKLSSATSGEVMYRPTFIGTMPAVLQHTEEQRLHFVFIYDRPSFPHSRAHFEVAGSVIAVEIAQRYASMRGNR